MIVQAMEDGRVAWLDTAATALRPGFVEVPGGVMPEQPEVPAGKMPQLRFDFEERKLYWSLVDAPQEPEPTVEPEETSPTHEEVEVARAAAYRQTVDPLTCEIQRLRDMGGAEDEIADAEARRAKVVSAIKEQYPYPEETNG